MQLPGAPATPSRPYAYHLAVQATMRDTDGMGHVNNAVFLSWTEVIRTHYVIERRGIRDLSEVDFVLASATLDFRSPVFMMEVVDLWCSPSRIGRKSWELVYEMRARTDGRLVAGARTVQAHYDYAARRAVEIPDVWRRTLEADLISEGEPR
jgi:acyl-CoA thioester hydrolase